MSKRQRLILFLEDALPASLIIGHAISVMIFIDTFAIPWEAVLYYCALSVVAAIWFMLTWCSASYIISELSLMLRPKRKKVKASKNIFTKGFYRRNDE